MRKSLLILVLALGCIGLQAQNYHMTLHQSGTVIYDKDVNTIQEVRFQGSQPINMVINAETVSTFPITQFDSITFYVDTPTPPQQYTITATANNGAWGTVTGGGTFDAGATCTLVATPAWGFQFVNWTKNGSVVSTNPSYSFTVTESAAFTANFSEEEPPQPVGDTVRITYNGSTASIVNPFSNEGVTVTNNGADVTVNSTKANVPYVVSGTSSNGSLTINSNNPFYLALSSLSLTSTTAAAINIPSTANVTLALRGTTTLADGATNTLEGAFFAAGNVNMSGSTLKLTGNAKHAMDVEGTLTITSGQITVLNAVNDGINCGTLVYSDATYTVTTCGSDGIETAGDCTINSGNLTMTIPGFDSKGVSANGSFNMKNGSLSVTGTGTIGKGIKADNLLTISGGTININLSGDNSNAISSDTEMHVSGGNITIGLTAMDSKGFACNGTLEVTAGDITVTSSNADSNGFKADSDLTVSGGTIHVILNGQNSNALSTETALNVSGGNFNLELKATKCKGLNSNGTINISNNCTIGITATQTEIKGIKADTNLTVSGGTINATLSGASSNAVSSETALIVTGGHFTLNLNATDCKGLNSNGTINISNNAEITVTATQTEAKGIKADGDITINGGTIDVTLQGQTSNAISSETALNVQNGNLTLRLNGSDCKGLNSNGTITVSGGTVNIPSTGATNKGIKGDGLITISGGTVTMNISGNDANGISSDTNVVISGNADITVTSSSLDGKAIKSDGTLNVNGGTIHITHSGNTSKGLKAVGIITISNGNITINSNGTYVLTSGDMSYCTGIKGEDNINITGGTVNVTCSTSNNGGKCISSDKNVTVSGGNITLSALGGSGTYTSSGTQSYTTVGIKSNLATNINGGTINMTVGGKGVSCDGNFNLGGGETRITTSGNGAVISGSGTSATDGYCSAGVSVDGNFIATAGKLYCKSTGKGGRGIKVDGTMTVGTLNADDNLIWIYVTTSGAPVNVSGGGGFPGGGGSSSSYWKGIPKGIKVEGNITINSGHVSSYCSQTSGDPTAEAIESKASIFIKGGEVEANSYDDAINCQTSLEVSGGKVWAYARGNDGIDCNGSSTKFSGGYVVAAGTEEAIDANCDGMGGTQGHLYICGSTILVFRSSSSSGGGPGGGGMALLDSPTFQNGQKRLTYSSLSAFTANNTYCAKNSSSNAVMIYKHPSISGDGMQNNWTLTKGEGDDEEVYEDETWLRATNSPIFTSSAVTTGTYTLYTSGTISGGYSWHGLYIGATCTTSGSGTSVTAQ